MHFIKKRKTQAFLQYVGGLKTYRAIVSDRLTLNLLLKIIERFGQSLTTYGVAIEIKHS